MPYKLACCCDALRSFEQCDRWRSCRIGYVALHLVRVTCEGGDHVAGLPQRCQHLLVVPQQAHGRTGAWTQRQVAAHNDALPLPRRAAQLAPQPRHLLLAGAAAKLDKAPLLPTEPVGAVLLLGAPLAPFKKISPRQDARSSTNKPNISRLQEKRAAGSAGRI